MLDFKIYAMLYRFFGILVLCSVSLNCLSQTKKETVDWLLQKFEKFKKDRYLSNTHFEESKIAGKIEVTTYYSYTNYSYFINGDTLLIKCNFLEESTGKKDIKLLKIDEIIISEISGISCRNGVITFNTYDYSIKTNSNGKLIKELSNYSLGGFNCEGEDELGIRVIKAFDHLKTFYPRVKLKEAF